MIKIKETGPEQAELCARLIRQSFKAVAEKFNLTAENCPTHGAFLQAERLIKELDAGHMMFALFEQDEMAGFCALEDMGEGVYALEKLAVLPERQRFGHGRRLVEFCVSRAADLGGKRLIIGIIEDNAPLKGWFERSGFKHIGTREFPNLPFAVGFMELDI